MKSGQASLSLLLLLLLAAPSYSVDFDLLESGESSDVRGDAALGSDEKFLLDLDKEVCYGDLGCFNNKGAFFHVINRPVVMLPESPEDIGTEFLLFTRQNPESSDTLVFNDANSVLRSKFSSRRPTKLVIHGFLEEGIRPWMNEIRQAVLKLTDCNVIQVGWRGGAVTTYNQATSNTRVVGAVVARMLAWLGSRFGLSRGDVHIIGFSLGAHVAGYAGERLRASGGAVSRITGLDPAGPYFEGTEPVVRLDPTDAQFVDVLHTDAGHLAIGLPVLSGGFGCSSALGHVDFYANGGHHQPGCASISKCDHTRAPQLFIASLTLSPAAFAAFPCDTYEKFLAGNCGSRCPAGGCPAMGFWAEAQRAKFTGSSPPHVHYLLTSADAPYAVIHYHLALRLSPDSPSGRVGSLQVTLSRGGRNCGPHKLPGGKLELEPSSLHRAVFACDWPRAESAPELQVSWTDESYLGMLVTHRIAVGSATLTEMAVGRVHQYCRFGDAFASGESSAGGNTC